MPVTCPISMASALQLEEEGGDGAAEEEEFEAFGGVVQHGSFSCALRISSGPLYSPTMTTATARKDDTQSISMTVRNASHGVPSSA